VIGNAPSAPVVAGGQESPVGAGASPWSSGRRVATIERLLIPLLSLFTGLVACGLLLLATRNDPVKVYLALWTGAVTGQSAFSNTLISTTPYILLGLAVALGFKGGLFNIGAEGQFVVGAVGAAAVGQAVTGLPGILAVTVTLLTGAAVGGLYAAIVGVLKVVRGAHEVITTIMLNYVAIYIVELLVTNNGVMETPGGALQQSSPIASSAQLPIIAPGTSLDAGILIALAGALVVGIVLRYTTWGFRISAVGFNPLAARAAGIGVGAVTVATMTLSGALSGLAGALVIAGQLHYLPSEIGSGFGFDAIAVAIIGGGSPGGIVLAALLLGALRSSATYMEQTTGIGAPFASVIEATVLFFVAAPVVVRFIYFRWRRRARTTAKAPSS